MMSVPLRAWNKPRDNKAPVIDKLASIRGQIKTLQEREKQLVATVKNMGVGEHVGDKCKAIVLMTITSRLNTAALKADMSDDMLEKYTTTSETVTVRIKSNV